MPRKHEIRYSKKRIRSNGQECGRVEALKLVRHERGKLRAVFGRDVVEATVDESAVVPYVDIHLVTVASLR